jgi:predicted MFS family arabinose efflux permease
LALAFGLAYAVGALGSHRAAAALGERAVLAASLVLLCFVHTLMAVTPTMTTVVLAYPLIGLLQGAKWPVVESYATAGRSAASMLNALGRFNVSWSLAVPLAVALTGPALVASRAALFWAAAALNVLALASAWRLPRHPPHAHAAEESVNVDDHHLPQVALLGAARWAMLASYALLFLLAPLIPSVFDRLQVPLARATALASLLDVFRAVSFVAFAVFTAWRGKAAPLLACMAGLPLGFALTLFADRLELVIAGQALFGVASGLTYTAALYYAVVLGNASVEAGGAHESLIGLGLALGPLSGMIGAALERALLPHPYGVVATVMPLLVACGIGAARSLSRKHTAASTDAGRAGP